MEAIVNIEQKLDLVLENQARIESGIAGLSQIIGAIGTGTRTIALDPGTGAPLLPETGGAINVQPVTKKRTSADEYWDRLEAEYPDAGALRNMPVGDERIKKAHELAAAGARLERRIAVQNWDPKASMQAWKDAGYTWIPALGQPDIPVSPGLTFFGKPSYDPANPPPGSITVDLSFADGYDQ